jgi:phage terminase Nu1 subunit (DNA packaging protein)
VGLTQLAEETGLAKRTLQYIAQREPGVLPCREGTRGLEYEQPACAINLRNREAEKAKADATPVDADYEKARARREDALAGQEELELRRMRGELIPVADAVREVASALERVNARLIAVPTRLAFALTGAGIAERTAQAQAVIDEIRAELRDDAPEEEAA